MVETSNGGDGSLLLSSLALLYRALNIAPFAKRRDEPPEGTREKATAGRLTCAERITAPDKGKDQASDTASCPASGAFPYTMAATHSCLAVRSGYSPIHPGRLKLQQRKERRVVA